jgi:hypothetical protein
MLVMTEVFETNFIQVLKRLDDHMLWVDVKIYNNAANNITATTSTIFQATKRLILFKLLSRVINMKLRMRMRMLMQSLESIEVSPES